MSSSDSFARASQLGIDISHWKSESNVHRIDPIRDWPASRQMAMMYARKTEMVKTVVRVLERSTVKAQRHDWRWLKQNDFITHFYSERFPHGILICTPEGAGIADQIAFHHAGELGMHLFRFGRLSTTCSCGWAFVAVIERGDLLQQKHRAASAHVLSVESGDFKPVGAAMAEAIKKIGAKETG